MASPPRSIPFKASRKNKQGGKIFQKTKTHRNKQTNTDGKEKLFTHIINLKNNTFAIFYVWTILGHSPEKQVSSGYENSYLQATLKGISSAQYRIWNSQLGDVWWKWERTFTSRALEVRIKMIGKVYLPTKSWGASKNILVEKIGMLYPTKPVTIYNWSKLKTELSKQY